MNAPAPKPVLLTRPFVMLTLANLMLSITGAFMIHLPGSLARLGAGEATIGRVLSLQALTAALLSPFVGRVMDRGAQRAVVRTGALLLLSTVVVYVELRAIGPLLYAARIVDGAGSTMLYASLFTYASDLVPAERRTEGIALFGASGLITMSISSLLGDWILSVADYRALFTTAGAFCAAGAVLCWMLPSPTRQAHAHGEAPPMLRTAMQRDLWPIWAAALAFFACMAGLLAFMKTFVLHTGRGSVGAFFTAYALCALVLRVVFGSLPDRVGPRNMVLPALSGYVLGFALLAVSSNTFVLLAAGALCGMGHGYAFPVLLSLVVARTPPTLRGTATATFTAFDWGGNVVAPPLLGLIIERAGYVAGFGALSALAAAGIAAFYGLDRRS
jgi:MFS family permease